MELKQVPCLLLERPPFGGNKRCSVPGRAHLDCQGQSVCLELLLYACGHSLSKLPQVGDFFSGEVPHSGSDSLGADEDVACTGSSL